MKSRYWIVLIGALFLLSCGLTVLFFLPSQPTETAEIWYDNQLLRRVDLRVDQSFTVSSDGGYNIITVENGKIAVTAADCPDGYCIHRGFCNSGTPIVCLPHRLIIKFIQNTTVDSVVG